MIDVTSDEAKVIDFRPGSEPRFEVRRRHDPYCKHRGKIILDDQERTLECDTCKAVIDPFDYFVQLANEENSINHHIKQLNAERKKLIDEQAQLKNQLANAKAALNRAKKNIND